MTQSGRSVPFPFGLLALGTQGMTGSGVVTTANVHRGLATGGGLRAKDSMRVTPYHCSLQTHVGEGTEAQGSLVVGPRPRPLNAGGGIWILEPGFVPTSRYPPDHMEPGASPPPPLADATQTGTAAW